MIKYLLLVIIFTGSPDKVGVQFIAAFDTHAECGAHMDIHNKVTPKDSNETLTCIKAEIND